MSDKMARTLLVMYALVAIFTFGHAANNAKLASPRKDEPEGTALAACVAGLLWPAYWSWYWQSK